MSEQDCYTLNEMQLLFAKRTHGRVWELLETLERSQVEQHRDLMEDFDIAFAYEGMARASALAGEQETARQFYQLAEQAGKAIVDQEDRGIFMADLTSGDWIGIR